MSQILTKREKEKRIKSKKSGNLVPEPIFFQVELKSEFLNSKISGLRECLKICYKKSPAENRCSAKCRSDDDAVFLGEFEEGGGDVFDFLEEFGAFRGVRRERFELFE